MKKILLKDYNDNMGMFIDINNSPSGVVKNYKHIPYEKLMNNYREVLNKKDKYYIYCNGGIRSKKAINILDFYGYDVTYVTKE